MITVEGDRAFPPAPSPALPFRFTGTAREYFGIWIVNLFLTIVTLGIYSAWAKVRKKRYFYGNTWVAEANFEYHGDPLAILRGRVLAFLAFVAYTVAGNFSPKLAAGVLLAIMPFVPWLLARSFAFNAANSSYRNIRFVFSGRARDVAPIVLPFALLPLSVIAGPDLDPDRPPRDFVSMLPIFIAPLVIALAYPYIIGALRRLLVNRSSFGVSGFECTARISKFYAVYLMAGVLVVLLLVGCGAALAAVAFLVPPAAFAALPLLYVVVFGVAIGFTQARIANLVFNATTIDAGSSFASTLKARSLARIYVFNALAIICTLGLAVPWAAIRTHRYRAECLALAGGAGLETTAGRSAEAPTAVGEEMGQMFDVDIAL